MTREERTLRAALRRARKEAELVSVGLDRPLVLQLLKELKEHVDALTESAAEDVRMLDDD